MQHKETQISRIPLEGWFCSEHATHGALSEFFRSKSGLIFMITQFCVSVKFPSLSRRIDELECVHVRVCVFASTHVISLGQVSVCLPVSVLWGECLPKECTTSDLSLTLIVRLIQLVPWDWVVLCPDKWKICAFLPLFRFWLVYADTFLDESATWWKSIKDGKSIWSVNKRSPDLHREKWKVKLLNFNLANVREPTTALIQAQIWLLLPNCDHRGGSCFGPEMETWDRKWHKSSLVNRAWCKLKWEKETVWRDWVELLLSRHIL